MFYVAIDLTAIFLSEVGSRILYVDVDKCIHNSPNIGLRGHWKQMKLISLLFSFSERPFWLFPVHTKIAPLWILRWLQSQPYEKEQQNKILYSGKDSLDPSKVDEELGLVVLTSLKLLTQLPIWFHICQKSLLGRHLSPSCTLGGPLERFVL